MRGEKKVWTKVFQEIASDLHCMHKDKAIPHSLHNSWFLLSVVITPFHKKTNTNSSQSKSILFIECSGMRWETMQKATPTHSLTHCAQAKSAPPLLQVYYLDPLEWNTAALYPSWSATWANELRGTTQHGWEIEATKETCKLEERSPLTMCRTEAGVWRYLPSRLANPSRGPGVWGDANYKIQMNKRICPKFREQFGSCVWTGGFREQTLLPEIGCIDHRLNVLTASPFTARGGKFSRTDRPRLMQHPAISISKPIQEPAFHGGLIGLNTCDSTAHTASFIISRGALNPHLFSRAPILVSPGSDWWTSAVPLCEKEEEAEEEKGKFLTIHPFPES